jgi:hypothetical protein
MGPAHKPFIHPAAMKRADNPVHVFERFMLSSEGWSTRRTLVDSRMEMRQFPQLDFSSLFVSALSFGNDRLGCADYACSGRSRGFKRNRHRYEWKSSSAVQITALQTATGLHRETLTSSTGTHDIPELPDAPVAGLSTGADATTGATVSTLME